MKKLIGVVAAGIVSAAVFAQETAVQPVSAGASAPATADATNGVEEASGTLIPNVDIEVDADIYSAYVWRGVICNDRPVAQPSVNVDWTFFDPFSIGFYVWENNDLTNRRREGGYRGEWNEWDYNIHGGWTMWTNDAEDEDDAMELNLEVGHEWYTYHVYGEYEDENGDIRRNRKDNPTTYEWYARVEFKNPIVTPYFQTSWEYQEWNGMYAEAGLNKEITLAKLFRQKNSVLDQVSLSGDFCLSGGSWKYLDGLSSGDPGYGYEDENGDVHTFKSGINAATIKGGLAWAPCDHFSIGLVLAFTSTLNEEIRDAIKQDLGGKRDLVWGGVEAALTF